MKKEKKPIQEQVRDDVTMLKKINMLKKRLDELEINMLKKRLDELEKDKNAYKQSGEEMGKEIASLKRQICGFKASNNRYKKQAKDDALYVKSLQNDLKEAQDEVDRIKTYAKIANLNATVEEKDRVIAGLQYKIHELNKRIANNEKNIQDLTGERDDAIANYEYVCRLPWYQRMFFKCN